jgi:hypothetical protein
MIVVACAAVPASAAAKYTFVRTFGKQGHHAGEFEQPWGLAIDGSDNLFATDRYRKAVIEFTGTGHFVREWTNHLSIPEGDAVTANGHVWVADSGNNDILEYTPAGHFVTGWHQSGPVLVDFVAALGNQVWYSEQWVTSPGDTTYRKGMITRIGGGRVPFIAYGPIIWGIAFGPNGNIYMARPQTNDVLERTLGDTQLAYWGGKGTGAGQFNGPTGIAVDRWGNVYVADGNNRVEKFSSDGTYLDTFGSKGHSNGKLNDPVGIAVDGAGNVYVADTSNYRIEEFAPVFPQTRFSLHGAGLEGAAPVLESYTSSSGTAAFQCRVDHGSWYACGAANGADRYTGSTHLKNLSEGKHTFEVRAIDGAGNTDPTPAKVKLIVDTHPPVLSAPVPSLKEGTFATDPGVPVVLSWSQHDNRSASDDLFDRLERRHGTPPSPWSGWGVNYGKLSTAGSDFTSVVDYPTPFATIYREYRAEALDQAGNKGVGPASAPFRAIVYQDHDSVVKYTGKWAAATKSQYPNALDGVHDADSPGATASLTFHDGKSVAVIGTVNSAIGTERICLDPGTSGQSCTTVTANATNQDRKVVFARNNLSSGAHTVRMTDVSGIVSLDAFEVLK